VFLSFEGRDGAAKLISSFKRGVYYCREDGLFERGGGELKTVTNI
jgi:hypothetical protein